jgi:hypothetical protein
MVEGVIPLGGGAATRSMEAGQSELGATGAMRELAAADRRMWGLVAHDANRWCSGGVDRLRRLVAEVAQGVLERRISLRAIASAACLPPRRALVSR